MAEYRFDRFSLDTDSLELRGESGRIALEPQVFRLLQFLIENRDRVVSKDEIFETVWDGRIVSDTALNTRIAAVRRALGDDGKKQSVIRTFPRRGFRFVAQLSESEVPAKGVGALSLPDKPSIAVLPFQNMSGDVEQEYFADGIAEDVITALSRYRWFFVIARNSSFAYKGQSPDIRHVSRDLGVQYVLEGGVRKAGNRVRVTAQLIDAAAGHQLWAERYDRELEDVFALQDEITETIVAAIEPELSASERERARKKRPDSLDAWSAYQRGLWYHMQYAPDDNAEARRLFREAAALDPDFAPAFASLADAEVTASLLSFADEPEGALEKARGMAERAIALDARDPLGHFALGRVESLLGNHDGAIAELEEAVSLNPSFARAHFGLAHALYAAGELDKVIPRIEMAIRLSPRDPTLWTFLSVRARAHLSLRQYEDAVEWARKAMREPNADFGRASFALISALGHLGRLEDARDAIARVRERSPGFSIGTLKRGTLGHFRIVEQREHILEGLRKAGLSD